MFKKVAKCVLLTVDRLIRFPLFYLISFLYAVLVIFRLAWSIKFKDGTYSWTRKDRSIAPTELTSNEYGEHKFILVNDIKLHYVEKGDKTMPLMVFVHGFPEFWYSWRYQIKEFSKNYRTVAIDLRGYGDSDKPEKVSEYRLDKMVEDIRQLVTQLDCKKFTLIAHDYGGVVSSKFVLKHMEMIDKYVLIGTASLPVIKKLISFNWYQFKSSWYVFFFQIPLLPELAIRWNDFNRFDGIEMTQDLEPYKYTLSKKNAITGPLNYYRANANILFPDTSVKRPAKFAPGLLLLGEHDKYIHRRSNVLMLKYYDNMQCQIIKNANHFAQQNQPEETNRIIQQFLMQNQ